MESLCEKCGKIHDGFPALTFNAPYSYYALNDEDRSRYVKELNDDFCVLEYEDQTDRFIRAVLFQQITDCCEELQYGIWVSLSEKSFDEYCDNFFSEEQNGIYFGFLNSQIPEYDNTVGVRTKVVLSNGRQRPEVIPHVDQMDIDFVKDYYEGITRAEAEERINKVISSKD